MTKLAALLLAIVASLTLASPADARPMPRDCQPSHQVCWHPPHR